MCASFEVQPSCIFDAGDGLFAARDIHVGELFTIDHTRKRRVPECLPSKESLSFSVSPDVDPNAPCCLNNVLTTYAVLQPPATLPMWVHADRKDLMKANDLAWPAQNAEEYLRQTERNAMELVLNFDSRRHPVSVLAYMTRNVVRGEEVGVTYGYMYWADDSAS